ncbi:MAG: hypothetical protein ACP6IP_01875 [Candidatus Njordarchaeia archaeon]
METESLESDEEGSSKPKPLVNAFHVNKVEAALVIIVTIAYLSVLLLGIESLIIILGFIAGTWYISRPSEWLYKGVNNLRIHYGLKEYIMGVLSAFAAIAAEIFITVLSIYYAYTRGISELVEIAVLSILFTMSFNISILGLLAIKVDKIPVALSEEDLVREMGIINWSMMASLLLAFLAITRVIFASPSGPNGDTVIPSLGALMLPISYAIYIYALRGKAKVEKRIETKWELTVRQAVMVTIVGIVGTLIGSEMIVRSAEMVLVLNRPVLQSVGNPVVIIALVIGFVGAVHDLVLNIFFTMKEQLSATVGNLVGSSLQLLLLILGIVGVFVPLPLTDYITFELLVISISLWFIRISISDKKVDDYDGALLLTLQILALALVLQGL